MKMTLRPLDTIRLDPCPECGSPNWVVDGDGKGRWWLLSEGTAGRDCLHVRDLPEGCEVVETVAG